MPADISLFDLVNLSIGTPEPGAVQFNALHTLLHALIKHLNIQDVKTELTDSEPGRDFQTPPPTNTLEVPREKPSPYHYMEGKLRQIEKQISALERLPSGTDLLMRTASTTSTTGVATPVNDMWQFIQLRRKVQANEDGVSKCMGLLQELMKSIQELKESKEASCDALEHQMETLQKQITELRESDVPNRLDALEQQRPLLDNLEQSMRDLSERLDKYPDPEEMTEFVTWEVLQHTLDAERESMIEDIKKNRTVGNPFRPFMIRRTSSAHSRISHREMPPDPMPQAFHNQARPSHVGSFPDLSSIPSSAAPGITDAGAGTGIFPPRQPLTADAPMMMPPLNIAPGPNAAGGVSADPYYGEYDASAGVGSVPSDSAVGTATGAASDDDDMTADDDTSSSPPPSSELLQVPQAPHRSSRPRVRPVGPSAPHATSPAAAAAVAAGAPGQRIYGPHPATAHYVPASHYTPTEDSTPQAFIHHPQGTTYDPQAVPELSLSLSDGGMVPLSRVSSGALAYPHTLNALRTIGGLDGRLASLEERVGQLETLKADKDRLDELRESVQEICGREMHDSQLTEEVNQLRGLMDILVSNKEKASAVEMFHTLSEESESEQPQDTQIAELRKVVKKLEEEMSLLQRDGRDAEEGAVVQQQLEQLRGTLEQMIQSSSSLLANSLEQHQNQNQIQIQNQDPDQNQAQESQDQERDSEGEIELGMVVEDRRREQELEREREREMARNAEIGRSVGVSRRVSLLYQRYERLQGLVNTLRTKQQPTPGGGRRCMQMQDGAVMDNVQGAILQLQSECEHLMEQHIQKQANIEELFKTVEVLDEKKADRDLVEMEIQIKADKRALESKVSRLQFDTMTEQLNGMFQELMSKMTIQEQDWNKVIDHISMEMESKLNRIELDPVKQQLEDRWKNIRKRLQAQPAPEPSDAAGLRRQLVARFHCISCDRPVDNMIPGPYLCPIPYTPGLHPHKSNRPYTVFELENIRQHSRSLRPGTNHSHYEVAVMERNLVQVQRLHTHLCQQLERAQSRLTPEPRPIMQALPPPPPRTWSQSAIGSSRHNRVEQSESAIARSCGGSHTLTYRQRHHSRLQQLTHLIQAEEECSPPRTQVPRTQPEEVDILGLDGHIYKGRLNTLNSRPIKSLKDRLPVIVVKEEKGNIQQKLTVSPKTSDMGRMSPARPQSANTLRSRSASSTSVKDRPLSSTGCMSQNGDQTQHGNMQLTVDITQLEDEPVTSL